MPFTSCGNRNRCRIIPYPAIAINDQGQIIGTGYNATGQENGFLLSPVPEPATIIVWSMLGLVAAGYGVWRRKRAA